MNRTAPRLRSTIRGQALLGLTIILALATIVSVLIDRQVARERIREEAQDLVEGNLQVVAALVADDRSQLRTAMRNNVQSLQVLGIDVAAPSADLRRQAGLIQLVLDVDGVAFVRTDGSVVVASGPSPVDGAFRPTRAGSAQLQMLHMDDGLVEAVGVPVERDVWLVALRDFDDARAYELRRLLPGNEVILVHHDRMLGSTTTADIDPVPMDLDPVDITAVQLGDERALVGLSEVGEQTYVGVVTPQLLAGLEGDLASGRLVVFLVFVLVALVVGNLLIRAVVRPLTDLADTAEAVRSGEVGRRFTTRSTNEIGQLAGALEAMRTSLGDQMDVISMQADAIRRATQRIVCARDVERRRMAQDLHDGVQQQLVMLRLRVSLLDAEVTAEERRALGDAVDEVMTRVRETSQAIFPSILADRGLTGALYSLAAGAQVAVELDMRPDPLPRLSAPVEAGLYFIVCEAMTNAVKHARAERVRIRVRARRSGVLVMVSDYGQGFDVAGVTGGSGLQNLHDRAVALGGIAHVRSEPGLGSVIAVRVPLTTAGSVGAALEEEQDRSDAAVEVVGVAEAELSEDGVGVLLDGPLADDELLGDGGVPPARGHQGQDLQLPRRQPGKP